MMNMLLLDLTTAWILKGMLEAMHNLIDEETSEQIANWFGYILPVECCPYGELGYRFESLVIDNFSEEFTERWYTWTCDW